MVISILTTGSRGDVQPFAVLGRGLREAGHEVRLAAHGEFAALATSCGLELRPLTGDIGALLRSEDGQELMAGGRGALRHARSMLRLAEPIAERIAQEAWEACQGAELILATGYGVFAGLSVAERLGIPLVKGFVQPNPTTPTRAFPCALIPPPLVGLGGPLNRLTHVLVQRIFARTFRPMVDRFRGEALGLPPLPRWWERARAGPERQATLYGFSRHVVPRPSDWDPSVHVAGYWFLDRPADWQPPGDLVAFLAAGAPPVYVGFGSMSSHDPVRTTRTVLQALALSGRRAVLLKAWEGDEVRTPDSVFATGPVPHDWLFPQMAAVVHHGGSGTTAAGLRAGVPSLVAPVFADQPFWGGRVEELGVGPPPIPHHRLTPEGLAAAITQAVTSEAMRQRATELGERIRAEDGVGEAVRVIGEVGVTQGA